MSLFGPKWPLKRGEHDTFELYKTKKEQISFYLKALLLTSPGENISDPNYGVGLRMFLFEMNTESVREQIKQRIAKQLNLYMAYLEVLDISVIASGREIDENTVNIKLTYAVDDEIQVFDLDFEGPSNTTGFY